jgi:hypothetical protein
MPLLDAFRDERRLHYRPPRIVRLLSQVTIGNGSRIQDDEGCIGDIRRNFPAVFLWDICIIQ